MGCGESPYIEYAGFWRRVGGYLIDGVIVNVAAGITAFIVSLIIISSAPDVAFTQEQVQQQEDAQFTATLASGGISLVISAGYVVFLNATGGTWGKRILGMRLERDDNGEDIGVGRAIVRYVVIIASALALGLGYLWCIWDEKKQTWHDKAAGSFVVRS